MAMKRILLVGAIAACGGKSAPRPVDNVDTEAEPAKPPYANLFVDGTRWQFAVVRSQTDEQDQRWTATCTVSDVQPTDGGTRSYVECDELDFPLLVGNWFTDGRQLLKMTEDEDDADVIMDAAPAPATIDLDGGSIVVKQQGDAWCWTRDYAEGDETWEELCFAHGDIVTGSHGFSGGMTDETNFELVTP